MVGVRLIPLLVTLALFPFSSVWAAGANSPEALAMALANAHRSGDAAVIVALHYFTPTQTASAAEQQRVARREWRTLIQQYQISGYRLSMLTAEDRQQFQPTDNPYLVPVKKLLITLVARHGEEKLIASHYITRVGGGYFLVSRKNR